MDNIHELVDELKSNLTQFLKNRNLILKSEVFNKENRRDVVIGDMYLNERKIELNSDKYKLTFITRDNRKLDNVLYEEIDFSVLDKETSIITNYNTIQNDFDNSKLYIATSEKEGDFDSFVHIKEVKDESKLLNQLNKIFDNNFKEKVEPKKNLLEKIKDKFNYKQKQVQIRGLNDCLNEDLLSNIYYLYGMTKFNDGEIKTDNFSSIKGKRPYFSHSDIIINVINKKGEEIEFSAVDHEDMGGIQHIGASCKINKNGEYIDVSNKKAHKMIVDVINDINQYYNLDYNQIIEEKLNHKEEYKF